MKTKSEKMTLEDIKKGIYRLDLNEIKTEYALSLLDFAYHLGKAHQVLEDMETLKTAYED